MANCQQSMINRKYSSDCESMTIQHFYPKEPVMIITWDDFAKIDIRAGTIIEVNEFPKAKKPSFQLTIDFGELGTRRSSAQVTDLYKKEELIGRQIIAVVNFAPKQIANFFSECLVLGVYTDKKEVVLLAPQQQVTNGGKIG
jgi:tRNA-binding protein